MHQCVWTMKYTRNISEGRDYDKRKWGKWLLYWRGKWFYVKQERHDYIGNGREVIIQKREKGDMRNGRDKWLYNELERKMITRETEGKEVIIWKRERNERSDYMMNGRDTWLYEKQEREVIIWWMGEISDYMKNIRERWLYEKRERWLYDEQERCDCMMNGRDKWLYKKQEKEVKCKRWLYEKRERSDYMNERIKWLCEKREMKVIIREM